MLINYVRRGQGKSLLLVHGLGSSWRSWQGIMEPLAAQRSVTAIDLPGFGKSPPLDGEVSLQTMADALAQFLREHELIGTDAAGSSVGAQLLLELARRGGVLGSVVSLGPGGFWLGWERFVFAASAWFAHRLARSLQFAMPTLSAHDWSRRLLLARFSVQPAALPPSMVLEEMRSYASACSYGAMLRALLREPALQGAAAGSLTSPLVIGWGRLDRVCLPRQAARAMQLYPGARLHWFERCGHFPHWDAPEETTRLILEATAD
ncbi:Dihydrolipoyllysine-residue acetyltransferase component of acetoin cleaving system [Variovorax sp. PBL-H6]|uniref:alpha/beta fold hydrolase n=1 Tax=Variovorax sp. PBL-H6 TaxID=434009 RepID=UPI0013166A9C|nr:alpha/beta fold hydrolase [Variovorax sp. PBL-H6]VTU34319.1 Dihydrolipoyllysine-residue acetyltransferase component of acetoin cleaving system [Variovorax sp. PBL-H6]